MFKNGLLEKENNVHCVSGVSKSGPQRPLVLRACVTNVDVSRPPAHPIQTIKNPRSNSNRTCDTAKQYQFIFRFFFFRTFFFFFFYCC